MADCAVTSSDPPADRAAALRARLRRDPFDAAALSGLGGMLLAEGRPAQAAAILGTLAESDPGVLPDLAEALHAAGLHAEAEARLRESLAMDPDQVRTLRLLVSLLLAGQRADEAEPLARRAFALDPDAAETLAGVLTEQGNHAYRHDDPVTAEALYRDAAALLPDHPALLTNLGNALTHQLRLTEADAAYRAALNADPANEAASFALALALLRQGATEPGFRLYEHRRGLASMAANYRRRPEIPAWRPGDDLAGRRVLVAGEQGAGDIIQFARYIPALTRLAQAVTLEVPWPMAPLFGDFGVEVIALADKAEADVQVPIMSLHLALGADAAAPPYLRPIEERTWRWSAWLDRASPGRRIGLVCSGDPGHARDAERSIALAAFAPLFDLPDTSFVVVQTELRNADWDTLEDADAVRCPGAALTDWADTAALLSGLDLLVTVDTGAAHLAGALGVPVWTLLPYCPDWRWGLGRDDCPWYPSMRLYRQTERGGWTAVLRRVREDLRPA